MLESLIKSAKAFPVIWKKSGLLLAIFFISTTGMSLVNQSLSASHLPQQTMAFEAVYFLLDLVFSSFLFLLIPTTLFFIQEDNPTLTALSHLRKWMNLILIEFIRAIASVLRWSLLLLLPGVYKQLRFYFVPFVVLFEPNYHNGNVDALQSSAQTTQGHILTILLVFVIDTLVTSWADAYNSWSMAQAHPLLFAVQIVCFSAYTVFFYSFLFHLFLKWSGIELSTTKVSHVDRHI